MFFINLIYLFSFMLVWWAFCGYYFYLFILSKMIERRKRPEAIENWPTITILVPCYNEEDYIAEKVNNISALEYPIDKLEIVFLDGLSTDSTVERLQELTATINNTTIYQTNCNGKINQINTYLSKVSSDIIVITDVDGMMESQSLVEMVKDFQSCDGVGVVGAFVSPVDTSKGDRRYWDAQNKGRLMESTVHSSSIVVGVCMAFKREVIDRFPSDVLADDVFLPFEANVRGYKSLYSNHAITFEKRAPSSFWEMVRHKFNKSNAYLKELFRFLYKAQEMDYQWQIIYFTKILQMFVLPWLLFFLSMLTCALIFLKNVELIIYALFFGGISLLITHFIMKRISIPVEEPKSQGLLFTTFVFLTTVFILLTTGISFPFYNQLGKYQQRKVGKD